MLGVVSEQFPKGGVLALNFTGAVGQVGVGVLGAVILGSVQDKQLDQNLAAYDKQHNVTYHSTYVTKEKTGIFGSYKALDPDKYEAAPVKTRQLIEQVQDAAKKDALRTVSFFPVLMLVCYLALIFYFRSKGGYKPVLLEHEQPALFVGEI